MNGLAALPSRMEVLHVNIESLHANAQEVWSTMHKSNLDVLRAEMRGETVALHESMRIFGAFDSSLSMPITDIM
jgi:hypothetical protein